MKVVTSLTTLLADWRCERRKEEKWSIVYRALGIDEEGEAESSNVSCGKNGRRKVSK